MRAVVNRGQVNEVALGALSLVRQFKQRHHKNADLSASLVGLYEQLKEAIENHQDDLSAVRSSLVELLESEHAVRLCGVDRIALDGLVDRLGKIPEAPSDWEARWQSGWRRRIDGELPVLLLQRPTKAMQQATQVVSDHIIKILKSGDEHPKFKEVITSFVDDASPNSTAGVFDVYARSCQAAEAWDVRAVINTLQADSGASFVEQLFLHFMFALLVMRKYPLAALKGVAFPKVLLELLAKVDMKARDFEYHLCLGDTFRASWLSDDAFISHSLYGGAQDEADGCGSYKGRGERNEEAETNHLGLLLPCQLNTPLSIGLPTLKKAWRPDAVVQKANYHSRTVIDSLSRNDLYISGTSGMTSLYMALMLLVGRLDHRQQGHYIAAFLAYIVGTGQHAQDEVLRMVRRNLPTHFDEGTPDQRYVVRTPRASCPVAPRAKLASFWRHQEAIDGEMADRRDAAFKNLCGVYDEAHLPVYDAERYGVEDGVDSKGEEVDGHDQEVVATTQRVLIAETKEAATVTTPIADAGTALAITAAATTGTAITIASTNALTTSIATASSSTRSITTVAAEATTATSATADGKGRGTAVVGRRPQLRALNLAKLQADVAPQESLRDMTRRLVSVYEGRPTHFYYARQRGSCLCGKSVFRNPVVVAQGRLIEANFGVKAIGLEQAVMAMIVAANTPILRYKKARLPVPSAGDTVLKADVVAIRRHLSLNELSLQRVVQHYEAKLTKLSRSHNQTKFQRCVSKGRQAKQLLLGVRSLKKQYVLLAAYADAHDKAQPYTKRGNFYLDGELRQYGMNVSARTNAVQFRADDAEKFVASLSL